MVELLWLVLEKSKATGFASGFQLLPNISSSNSTDIPTLWCFAYFNVVPVWSVPISTTTRRKDPMRAAAHLWERQRS
ncbi:hypothetical protein BCR39DRAFT_525880 [Naematelia encephala]|uniref:Uncharacterized protein n=1 Tax=Naematelia encephala TaxID=71784 RepID=A0A1Y2BA81_9TREE|nr:hypothetical protein BCR39DRAFT_525880 [Naematelia encephala]